MNENQIGEGGGEKSEAEVERENETRETRGAKWKFVLAFFLMVVLSLGGLAAWKAYSQSRGEKEVQALAEALQKIEQDNLARAMADTYGGKTPQETLRMYIDAVEKGDYELASKYFIEENREKELKSSQQFDFRTVKNYIQTLKTTLGKFNQDGKYDIDKKYFSIYEPILIRETLYPNDVWKIIEI